MRDSNPSLSRKTRNRILSQHEGFVPRLLSIFSSLRSKSTKYRWTRLAAPSYASLQMGTPCSAVRIPHSLARCNKTRALALVLALAVRLCPLHEPFLRRIPKRAERVVALYSLVRFNYVPTASGRSVLSPSVSMYPPKRIHSNCLRSSSTRAKPIFPYPFKRRGVQGGATNNERKYWFCFRHSSFDYYNLIWVIPQ